MRFPDAEQKGFALRMQQERRALRQGYGDAEFEMDGQRQLGARHSAASCGISSKR